MSSFTATDRELLGRLAALARNLPSGVIDGLAERLMAHDGTLESANVSSLATAVKEAERPDLEEFLRRWFADPTRNGPLLAWALRSSHEAADAQRRTESASLVWSGPVDPLGAMRRTREALLEVIGSAERELWVVSFSGYRFPEIAMALRSTASRGVAVRFVQESPEESEGKVTYEALKAIEPELSRVLEVYVWPADRRPKDESGRSGALHVKCAVADESKVFVSSANLSPHAMNLNMEMGILLEGGAGPIRAARHFRWLVAHGILVRAN